CVRYNGNYKRVFDYW
nr:immunoglobulin heavy chain junction region [Macaca mulatta]